MDDESPWIPPRYQRAVRVLRALLVVAVVAYTVSTVPGVRGGHGYDVPLDGWLNNGALALAAILVAVRAALVRADRAAWFCVAAAIGLYAVGNVAYVGWVQYADPIPYPSVADVLWLAFYPIATSAWCCWCAGGCARSTPRCGSTVSSACSVRPRWAASRPGRS